jgi:hypothetical protein
MLTYLTVAVAVSTLTLALAACAGKTSTSMPTVTVTQHSTVAEPGVSPAGTTTTAPQQITLPEVAGQNAEIVCKNLEKLGLTDVSLSSSNPKYTVLVLAGSWAAVSIEPPAGTVVKADNPVLVKVYKD